MFDKLKKLFVVSDEEFKKEATGKASTPAESIPETTVKTEAPKVSRTTVDAPSGPGDEKMMDILFGAIEKNNLEGFDYLEFKNSLQNLSDIAMDEQTRFSSALAMAKTMGASPQTIVNSAEHYLQVLKKEDEKFQSALQGQMEKVQTEKTQGLSDLQNSIAMKERQIEELQAEIAATKQKLENAAMEVQENEAKIKGTSQSFANAYRIIVDQIISDIKKIQANG